MLFNSLEFLLFLPIVFLLYWFVFNRSLKLQNAFIVVVSYIFYGWWDWRFLILIAFTSVCSYFSGLMIEKVQNTPPHINHAKIIATINVIVNLIILGVFKYFNFFSDNFDKLFRAFGVELDWVTLDILLPVGISFYTFQALSYTIDIYRGTIKPTHSIVDLFAYISFFPQLVAGPIERATNLLPQFYKTRKFDYVKAVDGCRQILWGFFKKIVIADNCAGLVNDIFGNYTSHSGAVLIVGAILFTFQIYGDFSGYSDIAIGISRLFGFNLMRNFNMPYFSRNVAEFWRKWHISLTTWFRDYIYIPLGGSRCSKAKSFRNTMIIFLVSGFWHGANWTFIVWGAYHALLFLPLMLSGNNRKYTTSIAQNRFLPSFKEFAQIIITFCLVVIGWIIFRADNIQIAIDYIFRIFTEFSFDLSYLYRNTEALLLLVISVFSILLLILGEWISIKRGDHFYKSSKLTVLVIVIMIAFMGAFKDQASFIYFQF